MESSTAGTVAIKNVSLSAGDPRRLFTQRGSADNASRSCDYSFCTVSVHSPANLSMYMFHMGHRLMGASLSERLLQDNTDREIYKSPLKLFL